MYCVFGGSTFASGFESQKTNMESGTVSKKWHEFYTAIRIGILNGLFYRKQAILVEVL